MSLKNDLLDKLPRWQRSNPELDEFLAAVGELLDDGKQTIQDFRHYSDNQLIDEDKLDDLAKQFDIEYPRNLSTVRKREYLQDAVAVYRSNGTERALKRIFKFIGWDVTLEETWTLNPGAVTDVQFLYNGTVTYEDSAIATYNTNPIISPVGLYGLIFGEETIYSNGTYADLHDSSGTEYLKNTILGEEYGEDVQSPILLVTKAPYLRIIVNEEDYDLFTSDVVDPDTGEIHAYTSTEEFEIIDEVITYFIEQARPANVAILEIATPFRLSDTFVDLMTDTSFTATQINIGHEYDGTVTYGIDMDRYVLGETFGDFEYGTTIMTLKPSPPSVPVSRTYAIAASGVQNYIPTRKSATVDLTVPSDATVILYRSESNRAKLALGTGTYQIIGTYSNVTNEIIGISDAFAVRINITVPSAIGTVDITVTQN